jgi:N-acetylneuraminic acid mutarotase
MRGALVVVLLTACGGDDGGDDAPAADATPSAHWKSLAPLPGGPRQETAVVALGGEIHVLGGFTPGDGIVAFVEVYDPATDTWRAGTALPRAVHHANAAVVEGKPYVLGALVDVSFTAGGDVWVYDPVADTWSDGADLPAGTERGSAGVGVADGKIYLAGGFRAGASVADVSVYDPAGGGSWTQLAPLPEARDHLVAAGVGGKLYAVGGRRNGIANRSGRVDVYDPATNTWSEGAPMLTARSGGAGDVVGGRIIVVGGEGSPDDANGVFPDNEAYDPVTDTWTALDPMPTPRHGMGAAALGGTLYVPGGATVQGFGATAVVEAFTP